MSDNPFAHLIKAPPPPQAPQQPQTIGGTRVLGGPPPSERRAQEDQAMERTRLGLSVEDQQIQRERLRLSQEQDERDRVKVESGFDATEAERKAAAFLLRALGANTSYEGTGMGPRSLPQQMARDAAPNVENYFISGGRQTADSAQDEFIAASLRQDSGAAIPEEELERQRRIYFPMPGDGPEAIEQKRQARIRAIEGLKQSSGRLLDNTLGEWQKLGVAAIKSALDSGASKDEILAIAERNGLSVDEAALDANIASRDAGGGTNEVLPPDGPNNPPGGSNPFANEMFGRAGEELSVLGTLGKQGITLGLSDEASGVGGAIAALLTGGDIGEGYISSRDAERAKIEAARQRLGVAGTALELAGAGGAVRIGSGVAGALRAARPIAESGQTVTRGGIQNALTKQAAGQGAALGATGGFGYGEGAADSSVNALLGAAGGAALGAGGQAIGNRIANRAAPASAPVQQAADNLGIEVIPAVTGGSATRAGTAGARQGFASDVPISKAVNRMESQGQAAREKIADNAGQVLDPEDAGNIVRQAANVYSERTSTTGTNLYTRAARRAGDASFKLPTAIAKADEWLAQLGKSVQGEKGTIYKEVKQLRDSMADGSFELMSIPRTRDEFRAQIQERGLRGSTLDTAMKQILKASEDDILNGLRESGKADAAGAFETATKFWQKRVETIDEVLEPILGKNAPKSGEKIVTAVERLANPKTGDAAQLRRLFKAMPRAEAQSLRATVINRMGRPTAGAAENADDAGFSFSTFLTNWNNMSPRAKATLFPKESRAALDDLVTVSKAVKEAGSAANTSNTARALTVQGIISLSAFVQPLATLGITGGQYAVGRLLASPKFARFLAGAPKVANPKTIKMVQARLSNMTKAEPALAREIGLYRQAVNDNMTASVAAEEPTN